MDYLIRKYDTKLCGEVLLSPSKSESNRVLLIKALSTNKIHLKNLSDAQDTQTMHHLIRHNPNVWDVIDAGTTMRFLTALLAIRSRRAKVITGSPRMKERPIGHLVHALRALGSHIEYLENEGYPPLKIHGMVNQLTDKIAIPGNISSQYISALLMIAPCLPKGLSVEITYRIFSRPYILMTLALMEIFGIAYEWVGNTISVRRGAYQEREYTIEADWSGASYWYSFIALSREKSSAITLPHLRKNSFQGDSKIADIMSELGVATHFLDDQVRLTKEEGHKKSLQISLKDYPDLAQTLMVTTAVKGIKACFTGLESLRIKETDRLVAMKRELAKIGTRLVERDHVWTLIPSSQLPNTVVIDTYEDHRMAMAFVPLAQRMNVIIKGVGVVKKSYPTFWKEVRKAGFSVSRV